MKIIPALYIKDGKVAAYRPGSLHEVEYLNQDPYELIEHLSEQDIHYIHLLDVDESIAGEKNNSGLIGSLCNTTVPDLLVGGGINSLGYLKSLQYAGVDYFLLGSAVNDQPAFLRTIVEAKDIPNDRIQIAVDVLDGQLMHHGWRDRIEEQTPESLIRSSLELGFDHFVCTYLQADHPERGPKLDFYQHLIHTFPEAHFTAAGHINTFEDIEDLKQAGLEAVLVGNNIYQDPQLLTQLVAYNQQEAEAAED